MECHHLLIIITLVGEWEGTRFCLVTFYEDDILLFFSFYDLLLRFVSKNVLGMINLFITRIMGVGFITVPDLISTSTHCVLSIFHPERSIN
jgi:hypothetical protein